MISGLLLVMMIIMKIIVDKMNDSDSYNEDYYREDER